MSSAMVRTRRRKDGSGMLLRSVLALLMLVPVGALFLQAWTSTADSRSTATAERHGIAYLQSLNHLTTALTTTQSAAVTGQAAPSDAVLRAVSAVGEADQRYGDELRTHARWFELRTSIEALPNQAHDPTAAYQAYTDVTGLLLALYAKVRQTSHLIHDSDVDISLLKDSSAEQLPETIVAAGRLSDLLVLAPTRPAQEQLGTVVELAMAWQAVTGPAGSLTDGIRDVAEDARDRAFGGELLAPMDQFQQSINHLSATAATLLHPEQLASQAPAVVSAAVTVQSTAASLASAMLDQLHVLITQRVGELDDDRRLAVGSAVLAGLLLVLLLAVSAAGRGRARSLASATQVDMARTSAPDVDLARRPGPVPGFATTGSRRSGAR
jgi:hypothetical protein